MASSSPTPARLPPPLGFGTYKTTKNNIDVALQTGYRLLDTATFYKTESDVGAALRESKLLDVDRDSVFVTTKVWPTDMGRGLTRQSLEASLRRLQLDAVDLLLVHWPGARGDDSEENERIRRETWEEMEELLAEGKTRSIGVSNYTVRHLREIVEGRWARVHPSVNQVEHHPLLTNRELRAYMDKASIMLQAYSPLAKGAAKLLEHPEVRRVARVVNATPAQVVIRWCLQHQPAISVIPRSSSSAHIAENWAAQSIERLSDDDMAALDALDEGWHCTRDPTNVR